MNEVLFGLTLAYVFFTALVLLSLIYSRIFWGVKALLIILAIGFYSLSYQGWKETQGWPSKTALPERFLLHYAVVEEPDKEMGSEGRIYMWLTSTVDHQLSEEPRAFQLDYDLGLHGKLETAIREINNGNLQLGELNPNQAIEKGAKQKNRAGQKYLGLQFVKLPDPALPEK
ncbi:hypothetical protein [Neptuniibacter sp. 1_MG-2023]|uniref:hypothetical protein n=1 Tax=Neptuniibacter sp. 1_MG-2023 TaxID=3062662 RepID=UPI0026E2F693|nr:hypothetical protein [Neptuniibacter sp. 1_MG-2023]MDO6593820.1 hypothetical protein [Neptuniibacter sp. 1_MG-2023]